MIRGVALSFAIAMAACTVVSRNSTVYRELFPPSLGLDEFLAVPEDNPITREKVALGARLFSDPIVSADSTRSCASCHLPERSFSDSLTFSSGVFGRFASRNTPSLVNRAYGRSFFWDGHATSLEAAVMMPIENPRELAQPVSTLVDRLKASASYRARFARAFPAEGIEATTIARALASYVRSIRSGNSAVDRYMAGDTSALSPAEARGRRLFLGKGRCTLCHVGPRLTDEAFHNTGVSWGAGDVGRESATRDQTDRGRFKTPSLRDVARTAPYMHDGSLSSLEDVVSFYNRGGHPNPNLDPDLKPRGLTTDECRDLVLFLHALNGEPGSRPPRRRQQ